MKKNLPSLTYIIGRYPNLTTTFIDREIVTLRQMGARVQVLSIRQPSPQLSAQQKSLSEGVMYLLPIQWVTLIVSHLYFALLKPRRTFSVLLYLLSRSHPSLKDRMMSLIHFGEGIYAAYLLRREPGEHLHAHFIDRAATVALVVSRILDLPYSVTAHASDIYVNPVLLREKLSGAKFVATCTGYNRNYLAQYGQNLFNHKLKCIYHGLDIDRYLRTRPISAGRPVILSVGQLKERKGLSYLVEACGLLRDRGLNYECRIVGEGPLHDQLESQIHQLGLEDYVTLCGAMPLEAVIDQYEQATVFTLPAVLGSDGDRDGIPNVILEALAMELPVVSTDHSGVPEVVENGVNGLLVPPGDAHALADALQKVIGDTDLRQRYGAIGRKIVIEKFNPDVNIRHLLEAFVDG